MDNEKKGKKKYIIVGLILLFVCIVIWIVTMNQNQGSIEYENGAITGVLPGKSDTEIQSELNQIVEEGMFNISISPEITFDSTEESGNARIENIKANRYLMKVTIKLKETNEVIYISNAIKPGQYVEKISSQKEIASGQYDAIAVFTALNPKTGESVGEAAAEIKIIQK